MSENLFEYRVKLAQDAIDHKEPERIPIWINYGSTPFCLDEEGGSCYKDVFYDHDKASAAIACIRTARSHAAFGVKPTASPIDPIIAL